MWFPSLRMQGCGNTGRSSYSGGKGIIKGCSLGLQSVCILDSMSTPAWSVSEWSLRLAYRPVNINLAFQCQPIRQTTGCVASLPLLSSIPWKCVMIHPNDSLGIPLAQGIIPQAVPSLCLPEGQSLRAGQQHWHRPCGRECHCALTPACFRWSN